MSAYYAAYYAFGLLLNEDETALFKKRYIGKNKEALFNQDSEEAFDENVLEELVDEWFSTNALVYNDEANEEGPIETIFISPEFCDGVVFLPAMYHNAMVPFRPQDKKGEYCTLIVAELQSSSIQQLAKLPFYDTLEEAVEEFKTKCAGILPEDFDYKSHIGELLYTVCA